MILSCLRGFRSLFAKLITQTISLYAFQSIIVYCICRNPRRRGMIGCDYCDEWFHPDCLSLTTEEANLLTEQKWKCPVCEGKATIDYEKERVSEELVTNDAICHQNPTISHQQAISGIDGQNSDDQPKRTKINVGPGEWLWLVGDQLIAPTKEEIYLERYWISI